MAEENVETTVNEQVETTDEAVTTDWKAIARRWERRSKQNYSELQDKLAEIESLKAAIPTEDVTAIKAERDNLLRQNQAISAAAKAGVDWAVLEDSRSFQDKLKTSDDIPALVEEFAADARFKPQAPTGIASSDTKGASADDSALSILLGTE